MRGDGPSESTVAVVIVAYECRPMLADCLASVYAHGELDGEPPEVWVVDNGSSDGTQEYVQREWPSARFIETGGNSGFSAANNLALREIDARYVLVLNPDTVLHEGALPGLVRLLDERRDLGMAGPRLIKPDGTMDHASRRAFPTVTGALGHFTGVGRRATAPEALAQYRAPEREHGGPVDALNGAFMLIRRAALDAVGHFDEGYWLYMEDLDLCYRFKEEGWGVWYEPTLTTMHIKGGTSGQHRRTRQNRAFHYGMFRFYRKFYAPGRPLPLNLAVYAGIAAKLAFSVIRSACARGFAAPQRRLAGPERPAHAHLPAGSGAARQEV